MKKKIIMFILAGMIVLSVWSCENREIESMETIETAKIMETIEITEMLEITEIKEAIEATEITEIIETIEATNKIETTDITDTIETTDTTETTDTIETRNTAWSTEMEVTQEQESLGEKEGIFSFDNFANLQFYFSSGIGGWANRMVIDADGSFSGEYFDTDMGVWEEAYPYGTKYQCDFSGQFTQPVKVNAYTYSMQISELNYEKEVGTEEIKDGKLYRYVDAYGLANAEDILIYLPGAPVAELPQEFRSWIGYYKLSYGIETKLPFYALNNEACQYGFSSFNLVDEMKDMLVFTEKTAANLENSIKNDRLTQAEYNEKSKELYDLWDTALNRIWDTLKKTQDAEKMRSLTEKQLEWIALKEETAAKEGAEYEGGSIQPMIVNLKAAQMTKDRVYKLMESFD